MELKTAIEIAKNRKQYSEFEVTEAIYSLIKFTEQTLFAQELVKKMGGQMVAFKQNQK